MESVTSLVQVLSQFCGFFQGLSMRETPEVHVPNHIFCSAWLTPEVHVPNQIFAVFACMHIDGEKCVCVGGGGGAVLCRKNKQVTDC